MNYHPNEVYINGYNQSTVTHSYYLNQNDNNIELVWYNLIDNCQHMFYKCYDITEINLSYFDTSEAKSMYLMFFYCSSLTSLNLSNFNTSKVTSMQGMFDQCLSLTSLNLSNFDTSKVSLLKEMFYNCTNLEYINMKNFKEISLTSYNDMFTNVPDNIVVCINENNIPIYILKFKT